MIYYVEDDTNIRELTLYALRQAGLEAEGFPSADPFFDACRMRVPDLVLLDIMLPGTNGMQVLEHVRADPVLKQLPVMMLTAKGTEFDKVRGLDAGADDYLAKPFGMMELISRCKALLRRAKRSSTTPSDTITCGCIALDPAAREASVGDTPVDLTLKEFDLLHALMENQGRVLTRAQLLEDVWQTSFVGETRTVDAHVQSLRRKLAESHPGSESMIQTVRGVGYCIKALR
ncbi:winged helix-turn-helix domain-containing protein [Curtanaerobium respiraculi]|jgi:two-component system alkaline phosphatase synthesis response regulator PhoP|uniref:winged helix-turn-helix domain-containing protein n=1 Tax=Curtanaerobium respiraculi TaxID=2949669 RepID=UPI0024B3BC37|nr:response regulator transcription factor [Curtanaerobium respiraculi]